MRVRAPTDGHVTTISQISDTCAAIRGCRPGVPCAPANAGMRVMRSKDT
eukprot:CAMPEP_0172704414 /NCGR_PEP_ID=MMETSP1074-20121228/41392_1 /TAXON_ID=2916 /ORGANISM="Ceratium fusus, Strain PA161109" /LENGTH=48 /DNA_ID= /DNA_START= /DNA_END= /DNA_ORIENTATION=